MAQDEVPFTHVLIDLDDTLYDEPRVPEWVRTKIDEYLLRELGCPKEEVVDKRTQLFLEYGTTMAGLIATGHAISFDDWHAWVHGTIPYDEWIPARPMLRAILEAIEGPRKWVFTNADEAHAKRCLERLGMDQGLFDGIISFDSIMLSAHKEGLVAPKPGLNGKPGPLYPIVCKPSRDAFRLALRQCGASDPSRVVFIDDSPRNMQGGKAMGMTTVMVGHGTPTSSADYCIRDLEHLPRVMPMLFNHAKLSRIPAAMMGNPPDHNVHHSASTPDLGRSPAEPRAPVRAPTLQEEDFVDPSMAQV